MAKESMRLIRMAQEIQVSLANLIEREIKDPRLGIVTLTSVEVSRDLAHAKVFFVVRDEAKREDTLRILNKASGFLRQALGKSSSWRTVPELHFHYDQSSVYGRRIDSLLRDVDAQGGDEVL